MRTRITPFKQLPHVLTLACAMTSSLSWAIEIEQRPLSTAPATASPAATAPASAPQPAAAPVRAQAAKAVPASLPAATNTAMKAAPQAINPAWDMFQQIEELRANVARLQGTLEEQQQLIGRLQSDLRTRYTDLDQRLEQLAKPIEPAVTAQSATTQVTPVTAEPALAAVVTTNAELATGNTVIPNRPKTETSAEEIERQKTSYLAAYQTFRRDGATPAITAMNGFLERYPNSVFAPNAYYWLGEFQLALEPADFAKAEANFQRVLRDYSASPKVASAYYKLGSIADLQGNRKVARDWMSKLIAQFPSSPESRLGQSFLDQNPAK